MNKTLLLILCDFLLLTILSMWKMEEDSPPPADTASSDTADVSVSAMAMMEKDLLDTLSYSLEEEKSEREELSEDLEAKASELAKREEELAQRQNRIQNLEQNLTEAEKRERELAQEAAQLETKVAAVETNYQTVTQQLSEAEQEALQSQAQSRLLQEELERKLAEVSAKEAALAQKNQELAATQQKVQELDVQVRMREQENNFLQESVSTLKSEVVAEREERQRIQEQSTVLAQGVSELASSSQDLRQELRSNFEINANQLFSDFKDNQIQARFSATKLSRNRFLNTEVLASTVLVSDGERFFAIAHIDSLPFGLRTNPNTVRTVDLTLSRNGTQKAAEQIQFLALDPRIAIVEVTAEEAATLGGNPYLTALEPFKFPQAVLVDLEGEHYGEVDFKLDPATPGFVKMQTKIFNSLFGEFSPSTGDLVLSKTGELLGVMVNRRYCALVNNFVPRASLDLEDRLNEGELRRVLGLLNDVVEDFPESLR